MQALDLATGKRAWRASYPAPYTMNSAATGHGKGPKSTPAVAGGRVFTFGISGILSAFDAATGRLAWRKDTGAEFGQGSPLYGVALSPVVDGGSVIVHVGGPGKGALTAFDAATGAVRWAWKGDGPAYASPVVATIGGVRQVVTFSESFLVGVSADRGELLWKIPFTTPWVQNAVTPVVDGDRVVYSGLDHPFRAIRVVRGASGWTTEPLLGEPGRRRLHERRRCSRAGGSTASPTARRASCSASTRPRERRSGSRKGGWATTRRSSPGAEGCSR